MCNDRSWKTCSIATIVFSSLLMLGMFIGVGVMNAMFGENMRCYRDVNSNDAPAPSPPGYVQCGTSRGNYILADSGARDCTGCGEAILSYDACLTAARSGTTAHYDSPEPSAALGKSENWDGPPGCQIRDEGSNFQFNANMDGASARVGYTPVCLISSSRREMFEEMHHIAAQHPSGDGVARVKLALSNIAHTFGLGAAVKQLPAALALSPEGRKLEDTHIYLEVAPPNDDSCHFYTSDGTCHDGEGGSLNAWCSCGTDLSDCGYRFSCYVPNDDSCNFASDGDCDDGAYGICACGTDYTDCGFRSGDCRAGGTSHGWRKTADESVEEIEKVRPTHFTARAALLPPHLPVRGTVHSQCPPFPRCPRAQDVLDVFNPSIIIPAIVCALFLYLGSGLTLCKVSHPPSSPLPTTPIPPLVTRALRLVKPREDRVSLQALDQAYPPLTPIPSCSRRAVAWRCSSAAPSSLS